MKKLVSRAAVCAVCLCAFAARGYAQSFGAVTNDKEDKKVKVSERGFNAQIDIDADLLRFTSTRYSDAKDRYQRTDSDLFNNLAFGGFNLHDDTNVAFGYTGEWYGGQFSVSPSDGAGGIKFGGIKAWIGFLDNKIKITAGNDIGYTYADSQGAEAGLRVYDDNTRTNNDSKNDDDDETVDASKNPDNITQDKGVLIEFDFDPFKIAFAGGGNFTDFTADMGSVMAAFNYEAIYGHAYQWGTNAGFKIGGIAKINAAYIFQSERNKDRFEFNPGSGKIIAKAPDAEVTTHLFGLYAGVYPFSDDRLGMTLGYAGVFTQNLEEYGINTKAAMPEVFKSGINLTARYKIKDGEGADKLTLKTDHNYSWWNDKNYKIFYLYKPDAQKMKDYGLLSAENGNVSEVNHAFL